MKKFNIKKHQKELTDINEVCKIKSTAAVQLVINNMMIYNQCLDDFNGGEQNKLYILYQMSSTIFKQLKEYKLLPTSIEEDTDKDEDKFSTFKNKFKKPEMN
jgi:hypothetical protein